MRMAKQTSCENSCGSEGDLISSSESDMAEQARKTQRQQHLHMVTSEDVPQIQAWDDFEQFIFEHPEKQWELYEGVVREKPGMASEHNDAMVYLGADIARQLDRRIYRVRINSSHIQRSSNSFFIPDICVFSSAEFRKRLGQPDRLEMYDEPLFLVVELWSKSTGAYDVNIKIPEYQSRGDLEIWRLHPYERTLTVWRRNQSGSYDEEHYDGGLVTVSSLPNVVVDLDALFDFA
jgi:Uma2 family endonuclease